MHYCDHALAVVRPSSFTFHILLRLVSIWLKHFLLLLSTAQRNSPKIDRKQELAVLYQVFGLCLSIGKRLPPRPLIGWYFFEYFSWIVQNLIQLEKKQVLKCRSKTKDNPLADPSRKMAHWTQVHDNMWTFWVPCWFSSTKGFKGFL